MVRMDSLGFVTLEDTASQYSRHDGEVSDEVRVNAYGDVERITEEEVPVSLLQTALQHSRVVTSSDSAFSQMSAEKVLDSGDESVLLQEEVHVFARPKGGPIVKPANWDVQQKAGPLPKTLQAMHDVLSMSPGGVFAATAGAVAKKSPFPLPKMAGADGSGVLDAMTTKSWPSAVYAQLLVMSVAMVFFVLQSFSADDLAPPLKSKKHERCSPPADAWVSTEPATVFVTRAARLVGMAGCSDAAEIRGPVGCSVLHAVVSQEGGRKVLNISSTASGAEPLVTVGPVSDWSVPQSVGVCRMSTGAVSSLELLAAGQWVLRRDGISVFTIKCDAQQGTLEVLVPSKPFVSEDTHDDGLSLSADETCQPSQRTVARAALKHCDAGAAFNFDSVEIAIASGDEVVLPLACLIATILMSPEVFGGSVSSCSAGLK